MSTSEIATDGQMTTVCTEETGAEPMSTTNMVEDGCVATASYAKPITSSILDTVDAERPDILRFLEKPIIVASGQITNGTSTGNISSWNLPDVFFSTNMATDKMSGVLGWKGDCEVTLQVNASRFQQALLRLGFFPFATYNVETLMFNARIQSFALVSQMPGVWLDVGTQTEVKLIVPWVNIYNFFRFRSTKGSLGKLFLFLFSPLQTTTGGDLNFDWTIWLRLINSEVAGVNMSNAFYASQAPNVVSKEYKGKVSGPAMAVAKAANQLSRVPMLSSIMGPVSWAADIVSGVSSAFGFSAARDMSSPTPVHPNVFRGITNCDQPFGGQSLTVTAGIQTRPSPDVMVTQEDEMNISSFAQRYSFFQRFTWASSDAVSSVKTSFALQPGNFYETVSISAHNYTAFAPFAYLATMHKYMRGGIRMKMIIPKTTMHSGRLMIAYAPYANASGKPALPGTAAVPLDTSFMHRAVIDIREEYEFEWEIPYQNIKNWLNVGTNGTYDHLGVFYIFVLNQLRAPAAAAQQVECILFVSGASDIEYAIPRFSYAYPILTTQMKQIELGTAKAKPISTKFAEESIGEQITSLRQHLKRFETLVSSNPQTLVTFPLVSDSIRGTFFNPFMEITHKPVAGTGIMPANADGLTYGPLTWYSSIVSCFAVNTGGVRWRAFTGNPTLGLSVEYPYLPINATNQTVPYGFSTQTNQPHNIAMGTASQEQKYGPNIQLITNSAVSNTLEFEIPQSLSVKGRLHQSQFVSSAPAWSSDIVDSDPMDEFAFLSWSEVNSTAPWATTASTPSGMTFDTIVLQRAVADDFNCFYFVSVPLVATGKQSINAPLNPGLEAMF